MMVFAMHAPSFLIAARALELKGDKSCQERVTSSLVGCPRFYRDGADRRHGLCMNGDDENLDKAGRELQASISKWQLRYYYRQSH